jgi:hypothetical protein
MKKTKLYILLLVLFSLNSCYIKLKHEFNDLNPTEYYYNFPINQVRDTILMHLCCHKYKKMYFEHGYFNYRLSDSLYLSASKNYNTFFLGSLMSNKGKSQIYYNWLRGSLDQYSYYQISLDSISKGITGICILSKVELKTGKKIEITHLGYPTLVERRLKVEPSTIEEYEIIKTIGDFLGEKDMPNIKYPISHKQQ